jgi:hypothetical protein
MNVDDRRVDLRTCISQVTQNIVGILYNNSEKVVAMHSVTEYNVVPFNVMSCPLL